MRKILPILALAIILGSGAANGGDSIIFGGHGGVHLGGLYWDVTDLNDYLSVADMDDIPTVLPFIGGGGQAILFERIVVGARGSRVQYHLDGTDLSTDVGISYGFLDLGFAAYNRSNWLVEPLVGIGGSTVQLQMDGVLNTLELESYSEKYDSRNPDQQIDDKVTMVSSSAIGHLGLSTYYQFRFAENEGGGFGAFMIGASAGWIFQISNAGWEIDGDNVRSGPDYSPYGAYLQLEVHFGGGTTQRKKDAKRASAGKKGKPGAVITYPEDKPEDPDELTTKEDQDKKSDDKPADDSPSDKPEGR